MPIWTLNNKIITVLLFTLFRWMVVGSKEITYYQRGSFGRDPGRSRWFRWRRGSIAPWSLGRGGLRTSRDGLMRGPSLPSLTSHAPSRFLVLRSFSATIEAATARTCFAVPSSLTSQFVQGCSRSPIFRLPCSFICFRARGFASWSFLIFALLRWHFLRGHRRCRSSERRNHGVCWACNLRSSVHRH